MKDLVEEARQIATPKLRKPSLVTKPPPEPQTRRRLSMAQRQGKSLWLKFRGRLLLGANLHVWPKCAIHWLLVRKLNNCELSPSESSLI